jgi:hypothetical protein
LTNSKSVLPRAWLVTVSIAWTLPRVFTLIIKVRPLREVAGVTTLKLQKY